MREQRGCGLWAVEVGGKWCNAGTEKQEWQPLLPPGSWLRRALQPSPRCTVLPLLPLTCRHDLAWEPVSLTQQPGGQHVMGRISRLPDEPHHAESVHAASWVWKGGECAGVVGPQLVDNALVWQVSMHAWPSAGA